ncbi:MAG: hypothetical protein QM773_21145 [Hyphomonadaceae bacterium]
MGMYNVISVVSRNTGRNLRLQFKAGFLELDEYEVGDEIVGLASPASCEIAAISETEVSEGDSEYYALVVVHGRVVDFRPISEEEYDSLR